jgi:hypothetical protein
MAKIVVGSPSLTQLLLLYPGLGPKLKRNTISLLIKSPTSLIQMILKNAQSSHADGTVTTCSTDLQEYKMLDWQNIP